MSKSKDDKDYVAEKIDPAEPPVAASDINEPPKPVKPTDEKLAHVHSVLDQIVSVMQAMAAMVPAGHSLQNHFAGLRDSLAALYGRAHEK
jgi:hypothetical protein